MNGTMMTQENSENCYYSRGGGGSGMNTPALRGRMLGGNSN